MLPPHHIGRRVDVSQAWHDAPCPALGRGGEVERRLSVRLEPTPLAPAQARRTLLPLCEHLSTRTGEDLRVMVSEVVTNSALYARARTPIRLDAALLPEEVVVAVTDGGPGFDPRALIGSRPGEPGGHGLELVAILSSAHGIGSRRPFCVWFALWRADAGTDDAG